MCEAIMKLTNIYKYLSKSFWETGDNSYIQASAIVYAKLVRVEHEEPNPLEMLESAYWYLLSQSNSVEDGTVAAANLIHHSMRRIRIETTQRLIRKHGINVF